MSQINVTLVRHGQTTKNRDKKVQSRTDALLSELGEFQCDQLGQYVAEEKFTHAFASDLIRTQQTAKRILKHNQNSPCPMLVIDSRVRERDFGDWEGLDVQDIFDQALKQGTRMHRLNPIPNGQDYEDFAEIALDFFKEICELAKSDEETSEYNILIVSHGGWILTLFDSLVANPDLFTLENYVVDESIRSPGNSSFTKLTIASAKSSSPGTPGGSNKFHIKFNTIFNTNHLNNH